jgi:multidrug resistance protein, MATE family
MEWCVGRMPPSLGEMPLAEELSALVRLAFPVMVSRAGLLIMTTVDTVMTGWAGGDELAYLAIGLAPFVFLMLVGTGLLTGTVVLVAQARGAGEAAACGRIWHLALLNAVGVGLLTAGLLGLAEPFLLAVGQQPAIARGGAAVAAMLGLGMPAMLGYVATTLYLEGLGRPMAGVAVIVAGNLLNVALNWLLVYGSGDQLPAGAVGAALATTIARWVMLALLVGYVLLAPSLRQFGSAKRLRLRWWLQAKLLRLGLPFAVSQGLETSAFQGLTLLCGWLGATALAAYQIAINVTALAFMGTVGLATATAVRVGAGIGAGMPDRARVAGWLGVAVTLSVMVLLAPMIALGAHVIATVYSQEVAVQALAARALGLVALVVIVDGLQGVLTGALRGAAEVWVPMAIHVGSFWLVLVPAAWLLAFPLGHGAPGLVGGMLAGVLTASLLLALRLGHLPNAKLARF